MKDAAYKTLVCTFSQYGSCVWDPQGVALQKETEKVQNRAARFVTSNYCFETGSMTGILQKLRQGSLKKRRDILLYKGLKDVASIQTDELISPVRCCRNHYSLTFQTHCQN